MSYAAYIDEHETIEERAAAIQPMIDSGAIWRMEGSAGREAMGLITAGYCVLGPERTTDYYGNVIGSRFDVVDGTKGSASYARELTGLIVCDGEGAYPDPESPAGDGRATCPGCLYCQ